MLTPQPPPKGEGFDPTLTLGPGGVLGFVVGLVWILPFKDLPIYPYVFVWISGDLIMAVLAFGLSYSFFQLAKLLKAFRNATTLGSILFGIGFFFGTMAALFLVLFAILIAPIAPIN
ncbi:MAG: hypothetical protein AAB443_01880 [Patescibacteria group bacterium]